MEGARTNPAARTLMAYPTPTPAKRATWRLAALAALAALLLTGCLHYREPSPGDPPLAYLPAGLLAPELAAHFAPAFLVHNPGQVHNRLGSPAAALDAQGWPVITVDPNRPAVYHEVERFATSRGQYTNLVYRVHFPATPFSLYPFFIGAGQNMGLLVVVTLDAAEQPVLVATAGTCGCYLSLVPTNHLPVEALPEGWSNAPLEIYGETLPSRLDYAALADPVLVVSLRPGEHRVMDLRLRPRADLAALPPDQRAPAELRAAAELTRLPLAGAAAGETVSLFHQGGPLSGHVKGAWKPWETLLMSWFSLDALVGMDKAYPDQENPFYTSLKPWARQDSDMRDYPRFLRYWGWRL
jgi:hypothetical protein